MTPFQLDDSPKAPWTSTTVGLVDVVERLMRRVSAPPGGGTAAEGGQSVATLVGVRAQAGGPAPAVTTPVS